jgi:hypothetical protein
VPPPINHAWESATNNRMAGSKGLGGWVQSMRIIVANEPCLYRDSLYSILRAFRPDAMIMLAQPAQLDRLIAEEHPHVVLCSQPRPTRHAEILTWIVVYPEGQNITHIYIGNEQETIPNLSMVELLAIIDQTEQRMHAEQLFKHVP